jgi:hypothetical protein
MFFANPTMDGIVQLILRLQSDVDNRFTSAMDLQHAMAADGSISQSATGASGAALVNSTSATAALPSSTGTAHATDSSQRPSLPFILGIGCVVPGPGAPQSAIMDVMIADMQLPEKKAHLFSKIGESSGIDRRYSVLPSIDAIYFGRKGLGNDESVDVRNSVFKTEVRGTNQLMQHWPETQADNNRHLSIVLCCSGSNFEHGVRSSCHRALGRPQGGYQSWSVGVVMIQQL